MTQHLEPLFSRVLFSILYFVARVGLELLYATSRSATCLVIKACRRLFSPVTNMRVVGRAILGSSRLRRLNIQAKHLALTVYVPVDLGFSLGDYVQTSFYFEGYPPFLSELICFADSETLFFDIGANVGFFSIAMGKKIAPTRIHAFEPVPSTFDQLRENVDANCNGAHVHCVAISTHLGTASLLVPEIDSGSASMDLYQDEKISLHEQTVRCRQCQVRTIAFDDFWTNEIEAKGVFAKKIAMKIDVEGHELKVLDGMQRFLANQTTPILIAIEVRHENILVVDRILAKHGFSVTRPFYNDAFTTPQSHLDMLYANSRR